MKITETKYTPDGFPIFYLADGSCFASVNSTSLADWRFYTKDYFKCKKGEGRYSEVNYGVCDFAFNYAPEAYKEFLSFANVGRNFEPYKYSWDGTLEGFTNGIQYSDGYRACNERQKSFCAAYIQYNGWKIPDDYPVNVSY